MKKGTFLSVVLHIVQAAILAGIASGIAILVLFLIGKLDRNIHYVGTAFAVVMTVFATIRVMLEFEFTGLTQKDEAPIMIIVFGMILGILFGLAYHGTYSDIVVLIILCVAFCAGVYTFGAGIVFTIAYLGTIMVIDGYVNILTPLAFLISFGVPLTGSLIHLIIWFFFKKAPELLKKHKETNAA